MTKANQIFHFLISLIYSTGHNKAQSGGMGSRVWVAGSYQQGQTGNSQNI